MTWHLGGGLDQTQAVNMKTDEASIVERNDGSLYMSIRVDGGSIYHGHSISYDGGATWSNLVLDTALTTGSVEGSIVHIDADTYVFSAPDSTTGDRQALTIWVSYDDMQTWVQTKTIDYGDAAYSDMVQVGPDTVLVMYDGGRNGTNDQYIALAAFNLDWLQSSAPDQFTWNFNEQAPGTLASLTGPTIMDSSPWDNRALALAPTAAQAPLYVSGVHPGDSALEITPASSVQLTPDTTFALQFDSADSFTVELTMRTTDSNGVIIGKGPAIQDWNLRIVNGYLDFTVTDRTNVAVIQSAAPINDGQWHQIAVVHDGVTHKLLMYIDGAQVAAPVNCSNVASMIASNPVMMGAFGDGSGHLDFDIDTLRVTRAALDPSQFLPANYTAPARVPLTTPPANAPTSLLGLQLWLPAYDPTRYFSGDGIGDPLPTVPVPGTAAHWALDASPNQYSAYVTLPNRELLYANDPSVGANWNFPAPQGAGERLLVPNSNGTSPNNFDFVQDTGVFTLSTFVNFGASFAGSMTLFDTADTSTINTGFTLKVNSDGQVSLSIAGVTGSNSVVRFNESTATGTIAKNTWYQIAVVGNGPGNPITFYVTPVTSSTVMAQTSSTLITGANGNYPTDAAHNLAIGSSDILDRGFFQGQMVDQAIYNRALSPVEIQQLFNFTTQARGGYGVGPVLLSSTNLDFGVFPYNSTATQTLRVVNGTNDADEGSPTNLTLLSATISGPGAAHYSLVGFVPGSTLAAGAALPVSVMFDHATGDPTSGNALLTLVTDQGAAPGSPGQTFTIPLSTTLIDTLDLNGAASGSSFTSTWIGEGPVSMVDAAGATLVDSVSDTLNSLTAAIDDPQIGDLLAANTSGTSITAAFVDGTLSLTGSDTVANYQAVLRSLTYTNTNGGPGVVSETVQITADDGVLAPATADATINIDSVPPIIDLNGSATDGGFASTWTPPGPVHIANVSTATLTDTDSANLASLVAVLDNPRAGDQLAANTSGTSITASFNNSTLNLFGSDTVAHYQQVLRTITYDNINGGPGVLNEIAEVTASDGALLSPAATAAIAIDLYPPVIDLNGTASGTGYGTFWTNRGPVPVIAEADATVADADSANLTSLTAVLSTPHVGDQLTADTSGTAIVASFAAGTLSLSGSDTVAHYQQVLRTICYDNSNGGPNVAAETIQFKASDGTLYSTTASATISIDLHAPVVDLNGQDVGTSRIATWTNTGAVALAASTASITDVDSTTLTQLVLTIVDGFADGDVLTANTAGSNITANFANGTLVLSGSDTVAHYQQVLRSAAFDTATIISGARSIEVVAYDDGTLGSNSAVSTIHLDLQAPILSMNGPPVDAGATATWTNHGSVAVVGPAGRHADRS